MSMHDAHRPVHHMAASPCGSMVVTTSIDGVLVWSIQPIYRLYMLHGRSYNAVGSHFAARGALGVTTLKACRHSMLLRHMLGACVLAAMRQR